MDICKNNKIDYNTISYYEHDQEDINKWIEAGGEITSQQENLECLCEYWNTNTIKHEYTYTITDLPPDRETPENYQGIVAAGVKAGFDRWGDINDITFTYTDSKIKADITIQQQVGNGRGEYGNAKVGCLFESTQCTIQLFTAWDKPFSNTENLLNKHAIEYVTAHEFGHLIGLPHHTRPQPHNEHNSR